jgi:hypothetical protein
MSLKFIGIKTCLWAKRPFKLSKDLIPKNHPNTSRKGKSKETMECMKVEEGGVQHNRYDDYCTKTSKGYLNIAPPKGSP